MKKIEYNYFDEFIGNTKRIVESAEILKETLVNYDIEKLDDNISRVHKLENEADLVLHSMRNYLIKDFLPPIDREDISGIGHKLDDIEDGIDEILINLSILNINKLREDSIEFADLLIIHSNIVKEMFENLKNLKKTDLIKEKVIEINKLEEQGDRLFERVMKKLYREETDPLEIMKWTTIYNCFENVSDTCEGVADCIEDVIMKNS